MSQKTYVPPTTTDLQRLKESLQKTGDQMADLFALGGNHQWRKYTGGSEPRGMSEHMLFYGAAALELDAATLTKVRRRMASIGAVMRLAVDGEFTDQGDEFTYRLEFELRQDGQIEVTGTTTRVAQAGPVTIEPRTLSPRSLEEAARDANRFAREDIQRRRACDRP